MSGAQYQAICILNLDVPEALGMSVMKALASNMLGALVNHSCFSGMSGHDCIESQKVNSWKLTEIALDTKTLNHNCICLRGCSRDRFCRA